MPCPRPRSPPTRCAEVVVALQQRTRRVSPACNLRITPLQQAARKTACARCTGASQGETAMTPRGFMSQALSGAHAALGALAALQLAVGVPLASAAAAPARTGDQLTNTPIKHVIVIIGENRSFDHVFATYQPRHGEHVWNLLSEGIVNNDGSPGPNFERAQQR